MSVKMPNLDWKHEPLSESFHAFKARINLYFEDQEIDDDAKQAVKIKIAIGDEGMRRILSSGLSDEDKKIPEKIFELLEHQLDASVKINFRVHRLEFAQLWQKSTENITDFISRLREKASKCDFDLDELNQRLIEMTILSTPHVDFRKELLTKPKEHKIAQVIERGREYEAISASQFTIKNLCGEKESSSIDVVKKTFAKPCYNCNLRHAFRECPAYEDVCSNCKKKGHWAKCCRSSGARPQARGPPDPKVGKPHESKTSRSSRSKHTGKYKDTREHKQHELYLQEDVDSDASDDYSYTKVFYSIQDGKNSEAFAKLDVIHTNLAANGRIQIKIDTGAAGNTLPVRTYKQMFDNPTNELLQLEPNVKLTSYSDTKIPCIGSIKLGIKKKSHSNYHYTKFYVVDVDGPAVLGLPSCTALDIVNISVDSFSPENDNIRKHAHPKIQCIDDLKYLYPDCFDKIGNFKREEELQVKPDAEPFIDPPRRCPIHLKDKIKHKLDEMEQDGIIKPVTKPTEWCSSITCPTKTDGSLRICLDPKKLNQNLVQRPHKIPSVEEITPCFANAKYFSKLDAKAGYWSVRLAESCQELTTFRTPFGRYCFRRLPFGVKIAQDAFQERMDEILDKCEGVTGISDDIVVYAESEEQHDSRLINLMDTAREEGLVFNSAKCQIKVKEITFFGRKYTDKGVFPDPDKVQDIINMQTPQNKDELQRFLGMLTFLSNHLPNISHHTATLRDLIKTGTPFEWSEDHQETFTKLKQLVGHNIGLTYFNPQEKTTLEVDASLKGLGAVLVQNNMPTAFASKALTTAQSNYSNIERECLAVIFGIQRFHQFLFGKEFEVITDCKPLEMIFRKPLHSAPPRLQRIMIKVQGYNFTVRHKAGIDNILPDVLSRLPNPHTAEEFELDKSVDNIDLDIDMLNFSYDKQSHIRNEVICDTTLSKLIQIIYEGWPTTMKDLPVDIRPYWNYRDELGVSNGILFKGNQVIIPESIRMDILKQLHEGHQGIEKTRRLARQYVYWPNFNKDIEKLCSSCKFCQEQQPKQAKEPIISHERPNKKWQKVGTDLFSTKGRNYLIIADYYSRYPYVKQINSLTAKTVVNSTKECLSLFGIPSEIVSDNGPCYLSEYDKMCEQLGITHTKISPRHPQGNGFIERQIGYIKPIIRKCIESNTDIDIALLNVRATPIDQYLPSPAELMFGYKLSTVLPNKTDEVPNVNHAERMQQIKENQERYGNQHTKSLRPLLNDENVRILDPDKKIWFMGKVLSPQGDRSYVIETEGGRIIRRNRVHLRPIPASNQRPAPVLNQEELVNVVPDIRANPVEFRPELVEAKPQESSTNNTEEMTRKSSRVHKAPQRLIETI